MNNKTDDFQNKAYLTESLIISMALERIKMNQFVGRNYENKHEKW